MRIALVNQVLMLATKHQNVNSAIVARGDKGISLLHLALKPTGFQFLFPFTSPTEVKKMESDPSMLDSLMFLGFYTVPSAAWNLATLASIYESQLAAKKDLPETTLRTFSEQLVEKLIMSSTCLSNPSAEMPEGHELWRLCLAGESQEVFTPSDVEGGLSILPGAVLADFSAPRGMASTIASLMVKERELEHLREEGREAIHQMMDSLISAILSSLPGDNPGDDFGFGRSFGVN